MKKWKQALFSLLFVGATLGGASLAAVPVSAVNVFEQCKNNPGSTVCASKNDDASDLIKNVINVLLYILGMIAVIMIVIGGIRYTTSNGDSGSMKSAKDTILYAVVGLILAMLSFAIVNFVVGWF